MLTPEKTFISGDTVTFLLRDRAAQTITCRIADACLTADTGAESSISAWSHILVEIWLKYVLTLRPLKMQMGLW